LREYSKVSPNLWQSKRFNSLASDDARYLYLYLLTNSHQTSAGCYRLPNGYACDDLRWPVDRYVAARTALIDADLVQFDADTSEVRIVRWFRHNPPATTDHLTGIVRQLERLQSEKLATDAIADAEAAWEEVERDRLEKASRKTKASGVANFPDRLRTNYLSNRG